MSDDDQRVIDALMAAQRKNRKIIPCPECERLREALAKSCEEGRDEMYDCGYNRLRAALERIVAALTNQTAVGPDGALEIAREALTRD
jgi:hypothetical protein